MYLVVCTYPNFSISKMLQSHTYNLKAVYKISTGRKYYEFYVEISSNCSVLASIFQNFPGGHAPRPPKFQHAKHAGKCALLPLPKRLVP